MKKFLLSLISICFCLCFFACGEEPQKLFFSFENNSITAYVGETLNIEDLGINSNCNYAQMHMYSSDDEVVRIEGSVLKAKKVGSSTITISGIINNTFLSDSIIVYVVDNSGINENDNSNEEINNNSNENNENNNQNDNSNNNTNGEENNFNNQDTNNNEQNTNDNANNENNNNQNNNDKNTNDNNNESNLNDNENLNDNSDENNQNNNSNDENNIDENQNNNEQTISNGLTIINYKEKIKTDKIAINFDILLNGEGTINCTCEVLSGQEFVIVNPTIVNSQFEIVIAINYSVEVILYSQDGSAQLNLILPINN